MSRNNTRWTTPQLIVLAKGTPEESVLVHCKTMNPNHPMTGPNDLIQQDTCAHGVKGNCRNCQARAMGAT